MQIAGALQRIVPRATAHALNASATLREHAVPLALILGFALAARVVWVAFSDWQPLPDDDAFRYDFAARALADGHGYVHLTGAATAFWPPGYPLLLATLYTIFGNDIAVAQALNVALGTATVALVYLLGRETFGPRPALVAAAIVAAFPSLVFFTAVTLSEVTFTFLALLAVYLLVLEARPSTRPGHPELVGGRPELVEGRPEPVEGRPKLSLRLLFAAGLVLGLASLTRGQALLLPIVAVPFWLRSGIDWTGAGRRVGVLALGIALIVLPWTVRNAIELDAPVLISTNAGVDFWIGHHEGAAGDFGATGGDELVFRYPLLDSVEREVRVNGDGFREGLEYAVTHPAHELLLPFQKLFWLYYNDEEGLKWNDGHRGQPFMPERLRDSLLALSNVYYFALLTVVALGVRLWFSLRDPGRLLLVSLVAYWTLVHLVFFGDPRFHAPIMPVAALFAAPALVALWSGREPWGQPG